MRFSAGALAHMLILVGLCCCLCLVLCQETSSSSNAPTPSARASLAPPKLFDFGRFKEMFKKSYGSLMEDLSRRKIYLARAFHAFLSFISYKNYKSSHYARINEMSDWTNDELRSMEIPMKGQRGKQLNRMESIKSDLGEHPAVELEEIEEKLRQISQSDQPAMVKIANELHAQQSRRRRRKREASLDRSSLRLDYFLDPIEPEPASELTVDHVASNNRLYEPPELTSFGVNEKEVISPLSALQLKLASAAKGTDYIDELLARVQSDLSASEAALHGPKGPDEVFVDHRDSSCFTPVKSQSRCGSCFIFSSTALYEYQHCKETGKLVGFSEQYVIDCGGRLGINGCSGGQEMDVSEFYHAFGIELASNYPYRHRVDSCPYDPDTSEARMGYLRVRELQFKTILHFQFEDYIKRMPILLGFGVSDDFHGYGGGVDMGKTCDFKRGHSMLVVGSGREDNVEYWLLRNSYGSSWGERGYYKIAKSAHNCFLDGGIGWVLEPLPGRTVFGDVNPLNDGSAVRYHVAHTGFHVTNFLKDLVGGFLNKPANDPNMVTPSSG